MKEQEGERSISVDTRGVRRRPAPKTVKKDARAEEGEAEEEEEEEEEQLFLDLTADYDDFEDGDVVEKDKNDDDDDDDDDEQLNLDNLISNVRKYVNDRSKQSTVQQLAEKAKNDIDSYDLAASRPKKKTATAFRDLVNTYIKRKQTEIVAMTTDAFLVDDNADSKVRRKERVAQWLVKNLAAFRKRR
jgi:hypothetical protein